MSLADRQTVIEELPLALMLVGVLVATFFIGLLVGAEAQAAGQPSFPPAVLPGLVWSGRASQLVVDAYRTLTSALWVVTVGLVAAVAAREFADRR